MKIILIPTFFTLTFPAFVWLLQFSVPLLLLAIISLVTWFVSLFFSNFIMNFVRRCCVLIYWVVTIFHMKRGIYTIVFFLEDNLKFEKLFLLFFHQASDECLHCMVLGIILIIWIQFAILMILYEIIKWIPVFKKPGNSKNSS